MTAHVGTPTTRAERLAAAAKARDRNRWILLGVLGVLLVVVLAFELPSTLNKLSPSSSPPAAAPTQAAAPTAAAAQPVATSLTPVLKRLQSFAVKDPFVAQLSSSGGSVTASSASVPTGLALSGPPVRTKDFVAKDPFVAQVATPAAAAASPAPEATQSGGSAPAVSNALPSAGFVVVLDTVPAAHGQKLAGLDVIAAENAGLVQVRTATVFSGKVLEVYTGPYPSQSAAQTALIRALRDGYTQASVSGIPHSGANQ